MAREPGKERRRGIVHPDPRSAAKTKHLELVELIRTVFRVEEAEKRRAIPDPPPPDPPNHGKPTATLEAVFTSMLAYVTETLHRQDRGRDKAIKAVRQRMNDAGYHVTDALLRDAHKDPRLDRYVIRRGRKKPK